MRVIDQLEALTGEEKEALVNRPWTEEEARNLLALRAEVVERCERDGWYWLRWVKTRDEADVGNPVKPFPVQLEYIRMLWEVVTTRQRTVVAKSRQMMMSWIAAALMVWTARAHPHQLVVYQTQGWEDAQKMVAMPGSSRDGAYAGRCQFIERNLPTWMRQEMGASEGRMLYPNGSMIEALPGGAGKIRGKTASLIVLDEMAFLDEAKATFTAIAPLIQKSTRFLAISTPNGGEGNFFYHVFHGMPMGSS